MASSTVSWFADRLASTHNRRAELSVAAYRTAFAVESDDDE